MRKIASLLMLISILFTAGCGTSTKLIGSHKNTEKTQNRFEKIGIAVLNPNESSRYIIERAVEQEFKNKNINATATYEVFPMAGKIGENQQLVKNSDALKNRIKEKIAEQKMDAVMFITLVNKQTRERYVNNNNYNMQYNGYYGAPYGVGYYGSEFGLYYNYYSFSTENVYNSGYYVKDVSYFLDIKLFDAKNEVLLWTGYTKTIKLESFEEEAVKFAHIIVNEILAKKVLVP